MQLELVEDRQTDATIWVEFDLGGIMRAIPGHGLQRRIQRVSDREMAAIKAAVKPSTRGCVEL
jgi:hypothetical protein